MRAASTSTSCRKWRGQLTCVAAITKCRATCRLCVPSPRNVRRPACRAFVLFEVYLGCAGCFNALHITTLPNCASQVLRLRREQHSAVARYLGLPGSNDRLHPATRPRPPFAARLFERLGVPCVFFDAGMCEKHIMRMYGLPPEQCAACMVGLKWWALAEGIVRSAPVVIGCSLMLVELADEQLADTLRAGLSLTCVCVVSCVLP